MSFFKPISWAYLSISRSHTKPISCGGSFTGAQLDEAVAMLEGVTVASFLLPFLLCSGLDVLTPPTSSDSVNLGFATSSSGKLDFLEDAVLVLDTPLARFRILFPPPRFTSEVSPPPLSTSESVKAFFFLDRESIFEQSYKLVTIVNGKVSQKRAFIGHILDLFSFLNYSATGGLVVGGIPPCALSGAMSKQYARPADKKVVSVRSRIPVLWDPF